MKRLLSAGSGPIFQICKAFRADAADDTHNPEFTIVEWYRPGMGLEEMMEETADIVRLALPDRPKRVYQYADLFARYMGLDPHTSTIARLLSTARERVEGPLSVSIENSREDLLDYLMAQLIVPHLGHEELAFLIDFPAIQACMARIRPGTPSVAERFELFINGVEIANGYAELGDPHELGIRFDRDLESLASSGRRAPPKDEMLLESLRHGNFPDCSGVALGLDRLIMIALAKTRIAEAIAFPISIA